MSRDPAEEQCGSSSGEERDKIRDWYSYQVYWSGTNVWTSRRAVCTQQSIELAPHSTQLLLNRHLAHKPLKREFWGNPSVSGSCLSIHSLNLNAKKVVYFSSNNPRCEMILKCNFVWWNELSFMCGTWLTWTWVKWTLILKSCFGAETNEKLLFRWREAVLHYLFHVEFFVCLLTMSW